MRIQPEEPFATLPPLRKNSPSCLGPVSLPLRLTPLFQIVLLILIDGKITIAESNTSSQHRADADSVVAHSQLLISTTPLRTVSSSALVSLVSSQVDQTTGGQMIPA